MPLNLFFSTLSKKQIFKNNILIYYKTKIMKTKSILSSVLVLSMIVAFGYSAMAQRGQGMSPKGQGMMGQGMNQNAANGNCAFLDLSADQQTKVNDLRTALIAKNLPLQNQLGELAAKKRSLQTGNNQDLKAISKVIDDMSGVRAQVQKNAAEHRLAVRSLLTDSQKVLFDAHQGTGKGMGAGKGMCGKGGAGFGNQNCPRFAK